MLNRKKAVSEIIHHVSTEYIELNDVYSVFRSVYSLYKGTNVISEEITEGIQKTDIIISNIENANKTHPNDMICFKTPEISRILRLYGFPNYTEYSDYRNPETNVTENPFVSFNKEINRIKNEKMLTIDYIEKNPSVINDLIIFDVVTHETRSFVTGERINQAIYVDRFNLNSDYVRLLPDVIAQLIKDGHLSCLLNNGDLAIFNKSVFGFITMSDDIFNNFIIAEKESIKLGLNNKWFDIVCQQSFEKDYFGFSDYYYGKDKNDPYLTYYDI